MVLDWITLKDTALVLPLSQNVKTNWGFYHSVTGGLLCSAGLDWKDAEQVPDIHTLLLWCDLSKFIQSAFEACQWRTLCLWWSMAIASLCEPRVWPWRPVEWPFQKLASYLCELHPFIHIYYSFPIGQAYKHIFTSPSSVEKEVKAMRSGNAWLHRMTWRTSASLAYIATLCHFTTDHLAALLCTVILLGLL